MHIDKETSPFKPPHPESRIPGKQPPTDLGGIASKSILGASIEELTKLKVNGLSSLETRDAIVDIAKLKHHDALDRTLCDLIGHADTLVQSSIDELIANGTTLDEIPNRYSEKVNTGEAILFMKGSTGMRDGKFLLHVAVPDSERPCKPEHVQVYGADEDISVSLAPEDYGDLGEAFSLLGEKPTSDIPTVYVGKISL